jgi:hypothetical protein
MWGEMKYLTQMFDYVPKGGGGGRKFPIDKGIIGRAFRVRGPRVENFKTGQEYRERMHREYGYTEEEMGERTPDRRSYLAYPIVEGATERVLGILYFDSDIYGTFEMNEKNELWKMICAAGQPIKRAFT